MYISCQGSGRICLSVMGTGAAGDEGDVAELNHLATHPTRYLLATTYSGIPYQPSFPRCPPIMLILLNTGTAQAV